MNIVTLIGLTAAISTTVSFLPQAVKTIKTRSTKDISLFMYTILIFGTTLWLLYGILLKDLPLILANGVTSSFLVVIFFNKIKYG